LRWNLFLELGNMYDRMDLGLWWKIKLISYLSNSLLNFIRTIVLEQ
jgi:hypothetical protein